MQIAKYILIALDIIVCVAIVIITTIQTKDDQGASGAIVGGTATDNFYEKNKGRTKEGKLKKWTVIFSVLFVIITVALGIIYVV